MKPSVLVARKLPKAVEARIRRDYDGHFNAEDRIYPPDELLDRCRGMAAVLPCHSEKFSADVIAKLPDSVRAICSFSVGVDHIDLAAAAERGITVTNTPEVLNDATAEIAMLCLLGAARRAGEGERLIRSGQWNSWSTDFMVGTQVTGKRLGIVGMGRIGRVLAKRARGFDMQIHYSNRQRLPLDLEAGATFHATVDDLLPHCDFLSLNCPATQETNGLLNAARIAALPRGAVVINTSRGAVIDEHALIAGLKSGHIAAAGLDVFDGEPAINPAFLALPNTFLMPHIGSATHETRDAMGFKALDNLDAIFAGREPPDRVA